MRNLRHEGLYNGAALIICFLFLFPLYWILISSLKSNDEIFAITQTFFPTTIHAENYINQFIGKMSILRPLSNSMFIAISTMVLSLLLGIPAAYGLATYRIWGKRTIMMVFLVTQMLPATLVLTPLFLTYSKLGIINTFAAPVLSDATIAVPFIVLFLRPFFVSIPRSIHEAALIDGCGSLRVFTNVIIPISAPGIVTAASFSFIFGWNDLIYAMTFITKDAMRPMTAGIYNYMGKYGIQWNSIMAYGVLLVLPIILVFIFLQRFIVSGLTSGSVKG
jgi:multiple sugar transport system permease protein